MLEQLQNIDRRILKGFGQAFIGYYALASLSLYLSRLDADLATIWFANMAIGMMLYRYPQQNWPWILIGAAVGNFSADVPFSADLKMSALFTIPNLLEMFLIGSFAKTLGHIEEIFESSLNYLSFMAKVTFVPVFVSSIVGAMILYQYKQVPLQVAWPMWMIADIVGGMLIFPFLIELIRRSVIDNIKMILEYKSVLIISLTVIIQTIVLINVPYPFVYISTLLIAAAIFTTYTATSFCIFLNSIVSFFIIAAGIHTHEFYDNVAKMNAIVYTPMLLSYIPPLLIAVSIHVKKMVIEQSNLTKNHFEQLYVNTPAAMFSMLSNGLIVNVSNAWCKLFGYSRDFVINRDIMDFIHIQSRTFILRKIMKGELDHLSSADIISFMTKTGDIKKISLSVIVDENVDTRQKQFLFVAEDVTTELHLSRELEKDKELLEVTLKSIGDGVIATDVNMNITFMNPVAEMILGMPAQECIGKPFQSIVILIEEGSGKVLPNPIQKALIDRRITGLPELTTVRSRTGEVYSIQDSIGPILGKNGELFGAVMVFQDVTESRAISQKMSYLAQHDALTDLPNRVLLIDRLNHTCTRAQRNNETFAVIFIDLDNFKNINDTLGHDHGDTLLKTIAQRLQACTRRSDTVSRLGGDEFVIILEKIKSPNFISNVCQKLIEHITEEVELANNKYIVSASLGVAVYPKDGLDSETLMRRADSAMYVAKNNGRNTFKFYSKELDEQVEKRFDLEQHIRYGIERDEFALFYQPIVDAHEEIQYVEGLCRWQTDYGQNIYPDIFIRVAEECKTINKLGLNLLRKACLDLLVLEEKFAKKIKISMNISTEQLNDVGFVDQVKAIFAETNVDPKSFIFEMTESILMINYEKCINTLHAIRRLGILIALDDFGTGYSSLSYLKLLPIDIIKIDRSFVMDLTGDHQNQVFIRAILSMAQALSIKVVAEGVETEAHAKILHEMGVEFYQGYLYSKPQPIVHLPDHFASQHQPLKLQAH